MRNGKESWEAIYRDLRGKVEMPPPGENDLSQSIGILLVKNEELWDPERLKALREEAYFDWKDYLGALHQVGASELNLGRGHRYDTLVTAAMLSTNLYRTVFRGDLLTAEEELIEEIGQGNISNDQALILLDIIRVNIPIQLDSVEIRRPGRLKPPGVVGLSTLSRLPTTPVREKMRTAAKALLKSEDPYAFYLFINSAGILNGKGTLGRDPVPFTTLGKFISEIEGVEDLFDFAPSRKPKK